MYIIRMEYVKCFSIYIAHINYRYKSQTHTHINANKTCVSQYAGFRQRSFNKTIDMKLIRERVYRESRKT